MARTVLVVTALEDVTADWVIAALNEREVPVVRVDPADIGPELVFGFRLDGGPAWSGPLRTGSRAVNVEDVGAVYCRRPTPYRHRFAQLPRQQRDFATAEARYGLDGVLHGLRRAQYVNHPVAVARAEFKPGQLQRFVELGLRIPATLVTNDVVSAREFAGEHPSVVCKTFRGLPPGEDGRAGAIWTQRVHSDDFDDSLSVTAHLVFGCFDFALTGDGSSPDDWWAIECNPNGQWGWLPDAPAITGAFADILSMEGISSSS
ncbi:MvdC/MvdD family ATP grasp protein [Streptomyces tendae]|uniref:MvdC/MvdD family ATP grasp protein n=1 Tax=Streptomyces tendae TaxID=1932 RepID=UPI00382D9C24